MWRLVVLLLLAGCANTGKRAPENYPILTKPRAQASDPVLICRRYPGRVLECAKIEREEVMRVLRDAIPEGDLK